jgi:hypothetical protein
MDIRAQASTNTPNCALEKNTERETLIAGKRVRDVTLPGDLFLGRPHYGECCQGERKKRKKKTPLLWLQSSLFKRRALSQ